MRQFNEHAIADKFLVPTGGARKSSFHSVPLLARIDLLIKPQLANNKLAFLVNAPQHRIRIIVRAVGLFTSTKCDPV